MVVRLHNVTKWALLSPGAILQIAGDDLHRVRVEFNCSERTRIDLVEGDTVCFIAVIEGHESVEFTAGPGCHLVATSDGDVFYFTNEGDTVNHELEQVSFTKVATRRARNPQLELMMFKMEQNINRRMEKLAAEQAAWQAQRGADPETGEIIDEVGGGATGDDPAGAAGEATGAAAEPAEGAAGGAAA